MKAMDILRTLGLLAGAGAASSACAKPTSPAIEVPAASSPAPATGESCLHSEGCCGGHEPGDGSCGEDRASADDPSRVAAGKPTADAKWSRTWTIAPGDMAEINLALEDGDTMAAAFSTDGATVKWNVHSHEGREAIIHAQGEDVSGQLRHAVAKGGMYSFLWLNGGHAPVRLTVELTSGAARVHSTHPAE
jgi:hypothetical protein